MTDQHYTHTCQFCKTEFPATLNKDGSIRKRKHRTCSRSCYDKLRWSSLSYETKLAKGRRNRRPKTNPDGSLKVCSVKKCNSLAGTRGYCLGHYAQIRAHGRITREEKRSRSAETVFLECKTCSVEFGPLKKGEAKDRKYCSRSCATIAELKRRGYNTEHKERHCHGCNKPFTRKVRKTNDSGKYCSRECSFSADARISRERKFLRSLAELHASSKPAVEPKLKPEISALKRISRAILSRIIQCSICQQSHVKRRPYMMQCSSECEQEHKLRQKEKIREYNRQRRKTEAGKASKRAHRSKRRARIRGAGAVESIDPIAVFENAKWVCHICGKKTLKSKRGTYHDRAPELEHIVAIANGGTHTWSNVACACRKCNIEKGANDYGQMGLL